MEVFISSSLSTSLYSVNCKSKAVHYMVVFLYCHYGISVLIRYKQISIRLEPRAWWSSQAASASDIDIWILADVDRMKQIFYPFLMKHLDLPKLLFFTVPTIEKEDEASISHEKNNLLAYFFLQQFWKWFKGSAN